MAYFFPKNSLNDFAFFWLQIKKYNQTLTESMKNTTWLQENCILLFCIERNNSLGVTESQIGSYVQLQFLVYMKTNQYHVHKTLTPSNSTRLNSLLSNSQQNFKYIFLGLKEITFNQSHLWTEYPFFLSEKNWTRACFVKLFHCVQKNIWSWTVSQENRYDGFQRNFLSEKWGNWHFSHTSFCLTAKEGWNLTL